MFISRGGEKSIPISTVIRYKSNICETNGSKNSATPIKTESQFSLNQSLSLGYINAPNINLNNRSFLDNTKENHQVLKTNEYSVESYEDKEKYNKKKYHPSNNIPKPKSLITKEISFKSNPKAVKCNSKKTIEIHEKDYNEIVRPIIRGARYLNICSTQSYDIIKDYNDKRSLTPTQGNYYSISPKKKQEVNKSRSLSNLLLKQKTNEHEITYNTKTYSNNNFQNSNIRLNTLNINRINEEHNEEESKGDLKITRGMRQDRGGVVDLLSLDKEKRKKVFQIKKFTKKKEVPLIEKVKCAKVIQKWWRNIVYEFEQSMKELAKIQAMFRMYLFRKNIFPQIISEHNFKVTLNKLEIPFENLKRNVFERIKNYKPIKINSFAEKVLISIDHRLKLNELLLKQKSFDLIHEKASTNRILLINTKFSKVFQILTLLNYKLNGNKFTTVFKQNQKLQKLKSTTKLIEEKALSLKFKTFYKKTLKNSAQEIQNTLKRNYTFYLLQHSITRIISSIFHSFIERLKIYESKPKLKIKAKSRLLKIISKDTIKEKIFLASIWFKWKRKVKVINASIAAMKIQKKTKKFLVDVKISSLCSTIIRSYLYIPFDKIKQEAHRRILIKSLLIIRNNQLRKLRSSFKLIKHYVAYKLMIMNVGATIIQHKFLNAFPEIKRKRKLREQTRNNNKNIVGNSISVRTGKFKNKYKQSNKSLRNLFVSHFILNILKPFFSKFIKLYKNKHKFKYK